MNNVSALLDMKNQTPITILHVDEIVAFHEAGHALVAATLPEADPVHKVTIVARGASGGHTRQLPDEDRSLWTRAQFEAMLAVMMGGQVAEEVVFGDVTTGASNDIQIATNVARKMVTEYGMSTELGPQAFDSGPSQVFLGRELGGGSSYSNAIAEKIDSEIGKLLKKARDTAKSVIVTNRDRLERIAERLKVDEHGENFKGILSGILMMMIRKDTEKGFNAMNEALKKQTEKVH